MMNNRPFISKKYRTSLLALAIFISPILGTLSIEAQTSATLPIVRQNYDVFTDGMGVGAGASDARSHYIFTSPTAIFRNNIHGVTASWSLKTLPFEAHGGELGLTTFNAFSIGVKYKQHAFLGGYRYLKNQNLITTNKLGDSRILKPADMAVDLGYAFEFNSQWSAFVIGQFVMSQINKIAYTGGGSIGVSYAPITKTVPVHLALSLRNVGGLVQYGQKGGKYSMPGSLTMAGDAEYSPHPEWILQGMTTIDYVLQPANAKLYTIGVGANVVYHKLLSMRVGGTFMNGMNYLSAGAGLHHVIGLDINASYHHNFQDYRLSTFALGITYNLKGTRCSSSPYAY